MNPEGIFNRTISVLENVLDLRSFRHKMIVSNVANMDTPGYKAFDVAMEQELGKAVHPGDRVNLLKTQPDHLSTRDGAAPRVIATSSGVQGADRNTVDINKTMVSLAENGIMYNALAEILAKKFQGLKAAIQEGKR